MGNKGKFEKDAAGQYVDYYQALGVSHRATALEIQSAFRKLSLKYHPDRTGNDPVATERFKKLKDYAEVLTDDKTRQMYDLAFASNVRSTPASGKPRPSNPHPQERPNPFDARQAADDDKGKAKTPRQESPSRVYHCNERRSGRPHIHPVIQDHEKRTPCCQNKGSPRDTAECRCCQYESQKPSDPLHSAEKQAKTSKNQIEIKAPSRKDFSLLLDLKLRGVDYEANIMLRRLGSCVRCVERQQSLTQDIKQLIQANSTRFGQGNSEILSSKIEVIRDIMVLGAKTYNCFFHAMQPVSDRKMRLLDTLEIKSIADQLKALGLDLKTFHDLMMKTTERLVAVVETLTSDQPSFEAAYSSFHEGVFDWLRVWDKYTKWCA